MTKVSGSEPPNRPKIVVRIPRNRLGKLNNKWNPYYGGEIAKKTWRQKSRKRKRSAEIILKKFVDNENDGLPHLPKLILKLNRARQSVSDSSSESETTNDESEDDDDDGDDNDDDEEEDDEEEEEEQEEKISTSKVTHYKKKIIQKHSVVLDRERNLALSYEHENALCESVRANENKETKNDSETAKTDSNNEQESFYHFECFPTSTTVDEEEIDMSEVVKTKAADLGNSTIAAQSYHQPSLPTSHQNNTDSMITSTDQNKNAVGKHVLPTVMVPQQQWSRVAQPLNDLSSNNITIPTSKVKEDDLKLPIYPNVLERNSKNEQNISKVKNVDNSVSTTTPTSSNLRRKKSIPVRRKSTITDECKTQNAEDAEKDIMHKNLNEKLFTGQNGLDLLSFVCTKRAPSTLTNESATDLRKTKALTASHEQLIQSLSKRHTDGQFVNDSCEEKSSSPVVHYTTATETKSSLYSPLDTKPTHAQKVNSAENREFEKLYLHQRQLQLQNSTQPIRHPPPPYDYATLSTFPYLNIHRDPNRYRQLSQVEFPTQIPQYNLSNVQNGNETVMSKSGHQKGYTAEQFAKIQQNAQSHAFYQPHQLISNPTIAKEHHHVNHYRPTIAVPQESLNNIPVSPKLFSPTLVNQQSPPGKVNVDANMQPVLLQQQHYQQQNPNLNQLASPPFDRPIPAPHNLCSSVETKENLQVAHQQQNTYAPSDVYELLNSKEQGQPQTSNPAATSVSSLTPPVDQNNANDIDRNQVVTLYYESQNTEGQNESLGQTVVYTVPYEQNGTSSNTDNSQQVNQRATSAKLLPTPKEITNSDRLSAPAVVCRHSEKLIDDDGRLIFQCSPDELANMIASKLHKKNGDKHSEELNEKVIGDFDVKTSENLPYSREQIQQISTSVIMQNCSFSMSTNRNTSNFSHRIENIINSHSQSGALNSFGASSELGRNFVSSVANKIAERAMQNPVQEKIVTHNLDLDQNLETNITKKTAEKTLANPVQEKLVTPNLLLDQNFHTKSVICQNFVNQHKYDNISNRMQHNKQSVSVNQSVENVESALNLTTSSPSTDTDKERDENKILNSTKQRMSVQDEVPLATTKSVIQENYFDQNQCNSNNLNNFGNINSSRSVGQTSEFAANLSSLSPMSTDSCNESEESVYRNQNPYFESTLCSTADDSESAINLTKSSISTNNNNSSTKKSEEKTTVKNTIDERLDSDDQNEDQYLTRKTKTPEHLVEKNKCNNISEHSQNIDNTFCVIVDAKKVKMDSRNTYDNPSNSKHINFEKQDGITTKNNIESLHVVTNSSNEKQVINTDVLNNECPANVIPDNKFSDPAKITTSNLDSEECNAQNTNEEESDNIKHASPKYKEREGMETMNTFTQMNDKLNRIMWSSSNAAQEHPSEEKLKKSEECATDNSTLATDNKNLRSETRDSRFILNNHFLFDMEFQSSDSVETIFTRILPSCFMILNLIQEMQNMNNITWWPVDVTGNLLKIKLSLKGIGVFLKRSKKLAVHLDPYIHYIFLYLLECFRTFRERVRVLVETGYTLKENYISMTESDIYRDVFIQLYDYLCCTRITDYVNLITRNDMCFPMKYDNSKINESSVIPRNSIEFAHAHQKHMLIIEKIKQRKTAEEERNECFKNFVLKLERQLSERGMSMDGPESDETSTDSNSEVISSKQEGTNQRPNDKAEYSSELTNQGKASPENNVATQTLPTNPRRNFKRPIECIVIDSDSDEEKHNSENTSSSFKRLRRTTKSKFKRISCIINLDDDGEIAEIKETIDSKEDNKRQLVCDNFDANKRMCPNSPELKQEVHTDKGIEANFKHEYHRKDIGINHKVENCIENNNSTPNAYNCLGDDNKKGISEKVRNMLKEENNNNVAIASNKNQSNIATQTCADLDIKTEIKCEDKSLLLQENEEYYLERCVKNVKVQKEEISLSETIDECKNTSNELSNGLNTIGISPKITGPNTEELTNSESDETVEAIENFLREMEANDRNNVKVTQREKAIQNSDETSPSENCPNDATAERLITSTNNSAFASQTNHIGENKLVGIATPNVKDSDVGSKKTSHAAIQTVKTLSDNNLINVLQNTTKEREDEVIADNIVTKDLDSELLKNLDLENNKDRSIIQKLISFRKPFRKSTSSVEDSIEHELSPEQNPEENEKSVLNYLGDSNIVDLDPKKIETSERMETQDTFKEVNNNLNSSHNQNITADGASCKAVNQEKSPDSSVNIPHDNKEKTRPLRSNVEMRRYSSEGYRRMHIEHQYALQDNCRSMLQDGIPTQPKILKRSVSQPNDYSAALKYKNLFRNYHMQSENSTTIDRHANMAISEYFIAHELVSRHRSNPLRTDANRRFSSDHRNMSPLAKTPIVTETSRAQQFQPPTIPRSDGKELLRQAITKKQAIMHNLQHTTVPPPDKRKEQHQHVLDRIPSLQSIYNESVNTNGFISQYIKDEIGVLSKKESLGPVEYVGEISTLMRLPSIPKDFKDFYVFVTKQQILQFHQPIAFHIFLELLNQSGLKDYHKKFTEYTKRKCEDNVRSRKDSQLHQSRNHTR